MEMKVSLDEHLSTTTYNVPETLTAIMINKTWAIIIALDHLGFPIWHKWSFGKPGPKTMKKLTSHLNSIFMSLKGAGETLKSYFNFFV